MLGGFFAVGIVMAAQGAQPAAPSVPGAPLAAEPSDLVRVEIRLDRPIVQAGREVWCQFTVTNLTDDSVTLRVPDAKEADPSSLMGLPLPHVFSGNNGSGLVILNQHGDPMDEQVAVPPRGPVAKVVIGPHASVGTRIELTHYYESLKRPGDYTLLWRPYHGQVISESVSLRILPERQAVILTDVGKMTMRFYYNEAPNHVANFLELVGQKFYDGLTFSRVIPGALIQGGDPRGDRRGIRADGKRLKAEFNRTQFTLGTIGMARSPRDPDSASCQFFICLSRQPGFDGQQTAFGYLVGEDSFETLRKIAAVPTTPDDKPKQPIYIRAITLENVPAKLGELPGASQPAQDAAPIITPTKSASPPPVPPPAASSGGQGNPPAPTGRMAELRSAVSMPAASAYPGRVKVKIGPTPPAHPTTQPTTSPG